MTDFLLFKVLNVSLSFLFVVLAYAGKRTVGAWLNPVSIFCLFWFLYVFLPLIIAFEAPVSPFAIVYILLFCLMFSVSSYLFNWRLAIDQNKKKRQLGYYIDKKDIVFILIALSFLAALSTLIGVLKQGISLEQILANPISIGGIYASKRYSSEIDKNVFSQVGLSLSYVVVVLGGLLYGARANLKSREYLIPLAFLPALTVMILQSAKGLFAFSIFLFIGGILIARVYSQRLYLFSLSDFKRLSIYGLLGVPFIIASFLSRGLYNAGSLEVVLDKLRYYLVTYSSVHLPAFSDWFSERYFNVSIMSYKQEYFTLGFYTFTSFFRLAGDDRDVPMGVYDEFFQYGEYIKGNLYTVFRGLITDFGLLGSLTYALLLGLICSAMYWFLLVRRRSSFTLVFFIYFVAVSYQTYIISSLTWLTLPFVFLLQYILMVYIMKFRVAKI